MELIVDGVRNLRDGVMPIKMKVSYPKDWKVTIVKSFDEFKGYRWHSDKTEGIEWEYVLMQDFDKNCNGYPIYWLKRFKRLAINRSLQLKRALSVGEAWNFGDNID